jgi:hypothetical protein
MIIRYFGGMSQDAQDKIGKKLFKNYPDLKLLQCTDNQLSKFYSICTFLFSFQ